MNNTYTHTRAPALSHKLGVEARGFDAVAAGVCCSGTDDTFGIAVIGTGAGSMAGTGDCITGAGAGAGGGEGGVAFTDTSLGTGTYIFPGGFFGGARIVVQAKI